MPELRADPDLRRLAEAATPGPWIRKWESLDVHAMSGDGVLNRQQNIDLAVAAVNALPGLLDRLAALEEVLALTPHGFTGGLEERIPWFIHCGISHGADRPDCRVCRLLSGEARAVLAGTPKP